MPIIYLVRKDSIPVYVGFTTKSLKERWNRHIIDSRNKGRGSILHNAIKKYGPDAFTVEEIYSNDDVDHTLNVMEPHFIREHHTHKDEGGYNVSIGGEAPALGMKHTEETKEKIRMIHSGRKFTDEHKKRMSLANKKRFSNPEERLKIGLAHTGRKHTEEAKQKIRAAHSGRKHTEEARKNMGLSRLGRIVTQETKEKISLAAKKRWKAKKQRQQSTQPSA